MSARVTELYRQRPRNYFVRVSFAGFALLILARPRQRRNPPAKRLAATGDTTNDIAPSRSGFCGCVGASATCRSPEACCRT